MPSSHTRSTENKSKRSFRRPRTTGSHSTCDLSYSVNKLPSNSSKEKRKATHLLGLEPCHPAWALPTPNHWRHFHQATCGKSLHKARCTGWILACGLRLGLVIRHNLPHPFWTLPLAMPLVSAQLLKSSSGKCISLSEVPQASKSLLTISL